MRISQPMQNAVGVAKIRLGCYPDMCGGKTKKTHKCRSVESNMKNKYKGQELMRLLVFSQPTALLVDTQGYVWALLLQVRGMFLCFCGTYFCDVALEGVGWAKLGLQTAKVKPTECLLHGTTWTLCSPSGILWSLCNTDAALMLLWLQSHVGHISLEVFLPERSLLNPSVPPQLTEKRFVMLNSPQNNK